MQYYYYALLQRRDDADDALFDELVALFIMHMQLCARIAYYHIYYHLNILQTCS